MAYPRSSPGRKGRPLALLLAVALCATILGLAPHAAAAPGDCFVSGSIAADTIWGPPTCTRVIMYGNVIVMPSVTLTIQPGLPVLADPLVYMYVRGTLLADGLPGNPITFGPNATVSPTPWGGIQFEATAGGNVSWSTFDRPERAVTAVGSAPWIHDNTILSAGAGFVFLSSSASILSDNIILRAFAFGVYVNGSDVQVLGNTINGTPSAIQVEQPGTSIISGNRITNVSAGFAVGIQIAKGATADVSGNTITGVRGGRGADGVAPGAAGRGGGIALAVLVNSATSASVTWNTIDTVIGGDGGNGQSNTTGLGGRGGDGGAAAGIVVAGTPTVFLQGNEVTTVAGGRGGVGGGSAATSFGGRGGDAGDAAGIEVAFTTTSGEVSWSTISGITGGPGGNGGAGGSADGSGGLGGDAYGIFFISVAQADASANTIQTLRGGYGGNTSTSVTATANGGQGGGATGISVFSVVDSAIVHSNDITTVTGGGGGGGRAGGYGGNASGVLSLGNDDNLFNASSVTSNGVAGLTGGQGGIGRQVGGNGGSATGIAPILVTPTLAGNSISTLQGGRGGDALDLTNGGRGGDAAGVIGGFVSNAWSSGDSISGVTKGGVGSGPPSQTSFASGYYLIGNASFTTRFTVENGTFASIGNYDFYVDNYTEAVALNTPLTTLSVQAAGNLTVRNFVDVAVFWPNGVAPVAGARIRVEDNGFPVWDRVAASGRDPWILVTDRIYVNSATATENATRVTVSYASYEFLNNARDVAMGTSHQEPFLMRDGSAPTSSAEPLTTYQSALTFSVFYSASDGNGTGLRNVSLWYRAGGSGGWIRWATQPAGLEGRFTFTAAADGMYEFATTVDDASGNAQTGPAQNQTWTIVDTAAPGSHVEPLPAYETSLSFLVTWGPDAGVTDIATYTIQYSAASGWVDWLVGTSATSGTFTAGSQIVYAFRSIAMDRAGNVEPTPSGNDTWALVDTTRPFVITSSPQGANASRSPVITIAFSEPMDRASVETAFLSAGINGTFTWSADSRVLTVVPSGELAGDTTYTVLVSTEARDLAGNRMLNALTFQFRTIPTGFSFGDFWWLFLIVGAVLAAGLFLLMRHRAAATPKPVAPVATSKTSEAIVEDVFLLNHRDGVLIKHETRRLRPDIDTDILSGMLTAVQQFVKDALRGDDSADLNEMTVGTMHILIGRGKWLVLAARIEGDGSEAWTEQIERCIKDMEDHHWDQLEEWDGDMALARVLGPYVKKLLQGGYT